MTKQRKRKAAAARVVEDVAAVKRRRLASGTGSPRPFGWPSLAAVSLTLRFGRYDRGCHVACRRGGYKEESPALDEPLFNEEELRLQYNTVRGYISAIQRLYEEQKSRNMNPAPRPQGIALKALKKSILAVVWSRKRSEYRDRLEGTIKDVYTPAQIPDHTSAVWESDDDVSALFRTQVDFLLGNHMLLRQSNRLPMELPDCFRLELPNEGQKSREFPTYALVIVMNQGKTNQHGRMEYGAALRHRDVRSCLIGALAFYFFWRWQVEKRSRFPALNAVRSGTISRSYVAPPRIRRRRFQPKRRGRGRASYTAGAESPPQKFRTLPGSQQHRTPIWQASPKVRCVKSFRFVMF